MTDHRIHTFLKLCELMNYRKTAAALNMTQPAVTQHIHVLEERYGCKLFRYNGRTLQLTESGAALERFARSMLYNEKAFLAELSRPKAVHLAIGATKTIGDYTFSGKIMELMAREDLELELIIDNTENLLTMLNDLKLDILLVEGFIDKDCYGHALIKEEELVGICAPDHPFAGQEVPLPRLLEEHLILREEGSGTRAVFEDFLRSRGYSNASFRRRSRISSFQIIEQAVARGLGISFVYESIVHRYPDIAFFRIRGERIVHEFNYVFLKHTDVAPYLALLK